MHLHYREDRSRRVLIGHVDRRPSEEANLLKWQIVITGYPYSEEIKLS